MSGQTQRVLVFFNPKAGASSGLPAVERVVATLGQDGMHVSIVENIDHFAEASAWHQSTGELRAVIAAGGDGTVALVANHTSPQTPIAVLPLGTENLLAKYLGISTDPLRLCRIVRGGATTRMDAARAGDRLFLLMLGCGLDADIVQRVHSARRGHIRHLSYVKPIIDSIRSYRYPEVQVSCDRSEVDHTMRLDVPAAGPIAARLQLAGCWVFVMNVPRYALGLPIVPGALCADGWLGVCVFKRGSFLSGLRYLGGILAGTHRSSSECTVFRTKRLRLDSHELVPYQVDGDPGGHLPVDIEVLPQRLTLLTDRIPGRLDTGEAVGIHDV